MTKKIITVPVGTPHKTKDFFYGERDVVSIKDRCYIYVEGGLDDVMQSMKKAKSKYYNTYTDLSIQSENDCGCRYDCSCSPNYYLYGRRIESDIEYEFRLANEKKVEDDRLSRERAEFERLKAKFEKD